MMCASLPSSILSTGRRKDRAGADDECSAVAALGGPDARFLIPRGPDPAAVCRSSFGVGYGTDAHQDVKFLKGTTTLAFKFQGGVVVSVDSRSTMGAYIASQTVKKVIEINPFLLGTMAGGAADCAFWEPTSACSAACTSCATRSASP